MRPVIFDPPDLRLLAGNLLPSPPARMPNKVILSCSFLFLLKYMLDLYSTLSFRLSCISPSVNDFFIHNIIKLSDGTSRQELLTKIKLWRDKHVFPRRLNSKLFVQNYYNRSSSLLSVLQVSLLLLARFSALSPSCTPPQSSG